MQRLASRLWPFGLHPGGLGWAAAGGRLADPIVLESSSTPFGWAGVDFRHHQGDGGGELHVQAGPARPEVARALLEWGVAAGGDDLIIAVADGDETLGAAVGAVGFVPGPSAGGLVGPQRGMFYPAAASRPILPPGYRVRSVQEGELEARVACHREAWRPAAMPLPPEVLAQVAVRGGRTVFVNSSPDPAYPAPNATYAAAGFKLVERGRAFRRKAHSSWPPTPVLPAGRGQSKRS